MKASLAVALRLPQLEITAPYDLDWRSKLFVTDFPSFRAT
jgi:hypothetical protein